MSKNIFVFSALFLVAQAQANSLSPCAPTVEAPTLRINCVAGDEFYTILVRRSVSPDTAMCQGKNRREYKTADVTITNQAGVWIDQLELGSNEFSYSTSAFGNATFESDKLPDFDRCVNSLPGGISVGN